MQASQPQLNSVPPVMNCLTCGEDISTFRLYKQVRNGKVYALRQYRRILYCSNKCRLDAVKIGEASPFWKGGRCKTKRGYIKVYISRGEEALEHVLIAERILGRPLKDGEVVHHINGDKSDNRNSNLLICTRSYHRWLHEEMGRRYMAEHFLKLPESIAA